MGIKSKVIAVFTAIFSKEASIILIATLPILELRGAIPVGIMRYNLPLTKVYFLSILGNLLPVVPLLLFFKYFFHKLENIKIIGKFFKWWFESVKKRSRVVEKYGFWGLVILVSIPLPITGAWTGTVAATLFDIKIKRAFLAIAIGVLIAGIIVTTLCLLGKHSWGALR